MAADEDPSLQKSLDELKSYDRELDAWLSRLDARIKRTPGIALVLEAMEPAVAGAVVCFGYLVLDAATGRTGDSSDATHFFDSTIGHLDIRLVHFALVLAGVSFAMAGAGIGTVVRRVVLVPILRLLHHLSTVVCGAFFVLLVRQMVFVEFDLSTLLKSLVALSLMGAFGVACFKVGRLMESSLLAELEKSRIYRWGASLLGTIFLVWSALLLGDSISKHQNALAPHGGAAAPAVGASKPS